MSTEGSQIMFAFKESELRKDPDFKGSAHELLGLSEYLCPECNAHLKKSGSGFICLNACHLPKHMQKRMHDLMKSVVAKRG